MGSELLLVGSIPLDTVEEVMRVFGGALQPMLVHFIGERRLSREELDKIATWIDLGVPFCGDYFEAGVKVAKVSYNGRMWTPEPWPACKEIR